MNKYSEDLIRLTNDLHDSDLQVRIHAVERIGQLRSEEGIPALAEILSKPDYLLTTFAVRALATVGSPAVVPILIRVVEQYEEFDWESFDAIPALGDLGDLRAVPVLLKVVKANWGRRFANEVRQKWNTYSRKEAVYAAEAGAQALVNELELRSLAIKALGQLRASDSVPTLIEVLQDEDPEIRWEASKALGEIADVRAVTALTERLTDTEPIARDSSKKASLLYCRRISGTNWIAGCDSCCRGMVAATINGMRRKHGSTASK